MKRYKPLLLKLEERRLPEYKAWFAPSSNKFIQFSTNGLHSEKAEENFGCNEADAIKKGYYRLYITTTEINIDSYTIPTEREFQAVKYIIEENSFKKISATRWNVATQKGFYYFPKLSFFFSDNIKDAIHRTFR